MCVWLVGGVLCVVCGVQACVCVCVVSVCVSVSTHLGVLVVQIVGLQHEPPLTPPVEVCVCVRCICVCVTV